MCLKKYPSIYEGILKSEKEAVALDFITKGQRSVNFNRNWRIFFGDIEEGQNPNLDISNWKLIDLPNDFSIDQEISTACEAESGFYPGGIQWYRKHFILPKDMIDKKVSLIFDGVYMLTEIYVNGQKVAEHKNGYSPFNVNLTDYLHKDGVSENQIALKVMNEIPSSRWYSGSGIYRDVILVVTDEVHIAYDGITITTPRLKEQVDSDVIINVSAKVVNESSFEKLLSLVVRLKDTKGIKVAESQVINVILQANTSQMIDTDLIINTPTLWDVKNPYLYKFETCVLIDGEVKDVYELDYGFRYFEFNRDTGFSLNGENLKLKGVNLHHDNGSLGAVAHKDAIKRQLILLKDMGANSIRTSHNPTSRLLLDEANRQGFLIIEEAFDGWDCYKNGNTKDFSRFFNETLGENACNLANASADMTWAEFVLKSMIHRGKNDPSIIMWSIGNEISEGVSENISHFEYLAKKIVNWVVETDSTRPMTIGNNRIGELDAVNQVIADAGGVVGFNYKNSSIIAEVLEKNANWTVYGSETTSAVHSRGEYGVLGKDDVKLQLSEYDNQLARVGWGSSASQAWKEAIEHDWNAGIYVWTGFDYIGEPTPWNGVSAGSISGQGAVPNSSYFGIIDTAGFPKDTYWLYRSMWNEESDTLNILSTWNDDEIVKQNGKVQVDVFTNAHRVELYLNNYKIGESISKKITTEAGHIYRRFENTENPYPTFMIDWVEGILSVKGFDENGNDITHQAQGRKVVHTSYEAKMLEMTTLHTEIFADGYSLAYIEVSVLDKNGNIVTNSEANIRFEILGPGKIVGVDNGNAADGQSYKISNRNAFHGKALVIVQSTREIGEIKVIASSEGLISAEQKIDTVRTSLELPMSIPEVKISTNYILTVGQKLKLPTVVKVINCKGKTIDASIVWTQLTDIELSTIGTYEIRGRIEGYLIPIIVRVKVVNPIVAVENYSTQTYCGMMPQLPQTLSTFDVNTNKAFDINVAWSISKEQFANEGNVEVLGSVNLFNKKIPVKAIVDVLPLEERAVNLVNLPSDIPVICNGYRKDNETIILSQAISGCLSNLNNSNMSKVKDITTCWTMERLRKQREIEAYFIEFYWKQEYSFANINLWHFTDNQNGKLPGDGNVQFEYFDSQSQTWEQQEAANITQVSYLEGVTPYGLISPITTQRLRIWLKQPETNAIVGLAQVEIWSHVESMKGRSVAEMEWLKIENQLIKPQENDIYICSASEEVKVEIKAKENGSVTLIPNGNGLYVVRVKSEDGTVVKDYQLIVQNKIW